MTNAESAPRLFVVVHDVAVPFVREVEAILDELGPLELSIGAALVPRWRGAGPSSALESLVPRFDEVFAHGLTHWRDSGRLLSPVSWVTDGSDELAGLRREAARDRLEKAFEETRRLAGRTPVGLLPPAWQISPSAAVAAFEVGFRSVMRYRAIAFPDGQVPVRTWSWDWGRAGRGAARMGELLQSGVHRWKPFGDCCVAFHPADVRRGMLPRAVRVVHRLLEQGLRPLGVAGLLEERRATGIGR